MKVSIITVFHNAEEYISSFTEKIEQQTFRDFELIFVDDESTDNSSSIVKSWSKKIPNIKYVFQKKAGPGPGRKTGLSIADGEYVYFIDIDDWVDTNMLSIVMDHIIQSGNPDVVVFNSKNISEKKFENVHSPYASRKLKGGLYDGTSFLKAALGTRSFFVPIWLGMYSRKFLEFSNVRFLSIIHEDCASAIDIFSSAKSVLYLNQILHYRLMRAESIMHREISRERIESTFFLMKDAVKRVSQSADEETHRVNVLWARMMISLAITAVRDSNYKMELRNDVTKFICKSKIILGVREYLQVAMLYLPR